MPNNKTTPNHRTDSQKALNTSLTPPEVDESQPGENIRQQTHERVDPHATPVTALRQPGQTDASSRRHDQRREDDRAPIPPEVTDPNYTAATAPRYAPSDSANSTRMQTAPLENLGRPTSPSTQRNTVRDAMTPDVEVANPDTELYYVARMMAERDIGAVPVVDSTDSMKPLGLITDRDITLRVIAKRQDPAALRAHQVMTPNPTTVHPDTPLHEVERLMQSQQLRRLLVTDSNGRLIGILAQADLARSRPPRETGKTVQEISEPK